MIKQLLFLISLIFLYGFAKFVSALHLGNGALIFPICMAVTVLVALLTLGYFYFVKKQKIFVLLFTLLLSSLTVSSVPAWAGLSDIWNSISSSSVAQKILAEDNDKGQELLSKIRAADKTLRSAKGLEDYEGIMEGSTEITSVEIDGGVLDVAIKTNDRCRQLEFRDSVQDICIKAYRYVEIANKVQNSMGSGCSPIAGMIKNVINKNQCWPCDITALVLSSIQDVAQSSYPVTRVAALNLMGALFLLWLAFVTLAFFGKFGFARISEYLTNVLNKAVLVLIVAAFLHMPALEIYKYTISPLVGFAAELSELFSNEGRIIAKESGSLMKVMTNIINLGTNTKCKYCENKGYSGSTAFLDSATSNGLLCVVCTVYHQVSPMILLGQGLTCFADVAHESNSGSSAAGGNSTQALPRLGPFFLGTILILIFSMIMLVIAYYLIISILQLGFVIILMPFWMVAFVFKASREYCKNAWSLVLNAMMTIVSLSLTIGIIMYGFSQLLSKDIALSLGWTMLTGSPTDVMDAFSPTEQAAAENGDDEEGSFFNGLTDKVVDMAFDGLLNYNPMHAILLLVAFSFLSVSMISGSSKLVERLLNIWLDRKIDPGGEMMQGLQVSGRTVKSLSGITAGMMGVTVGAVSSKYRQMVEKAHDYSWETYQDDNLTQIQAKNRGKTVAQFNLDREKRVARDKQKEEEKRKKKEAAMKTGGSDSSPEA